MEEKTLEKELEDALNIIKELEKNKAELIERYKYQIKLNKDLKKNKKSVIENGREK